MRKLTAGLPGARTRFVLGAGFVALLAAAAVPARRASAAPPASPPPNSPAFYTARVQPIFQANCLRCHGGMNHRGGLQMDTPAGLMRGGKQGVVIAPGHPEGSLLVKLIRHEGPANDPMPMPPKGKLSAAEIATVEQWVRAGAAMPPDPPDR